MVSNLFSSFDPSVGVSYRLFPLWFWLMCYSFSCPAFLSCFMSSGRVKVGVGLISGLSVSMIKGIAWLGVGVFSGLFMLLISVNLFGLVPWVISLSSQLVFSVSLGVPLWMATFLVTSSVLMKKLAMLVGSGLPLLLAPVIGIIEVGSQIIRPLTLTVRLAANMMAGHIIMALLMGATMSSSIILVVLVVGIYLFEMAICLVQSYVFILLLSIYIRE